MVLVCTYSVTSEPTLSINKLSGYPKMVEVDSQALQCSFMHGRAIQCKHTPYVTIHGKTNHIALGLNLRYEPNKLPMVIIIDFDFLSDQ